MKRLLAPVVIAVLTTAAHAQDSVPANVNDCTLIRDPIELRNCVLRFEGNRTSLPATVEAPRTAEPPVAIGDGPAVTDIPSPRPVIPPATRPSAGARPAASAPSPPARRPSRDTETSIEQVQIPR